MDKLEKMMEHFRKIQKMSPAEKLWEKIKLNSCYDVPFRNEFYLFDEKLNNIITSESSVIMNDLRKNIKKKRKYSRR